MTTDTRRNAVTVRRGLRAADRNPINTLLAATGFFNQEELAVAMELVDDRLIEGEDSHYRFLVAEHRSRISGYACWGPILGTAESADLYWIAVDPATQGQGIGRALLAEAENWLASAGRPRVWVETAGRPQYEPTRAFYLACGYHIAAELEDFYAPDDNKVIFLKVLGE